VIVGYAIYHLTLIDLGLNSVDVTSSWPPLSYLSLLHFLCSPCWVSLNFVSWKPTIILRVFPEMKSSWHVTTQSFFPCIGGSSAITNAGMFLQNIVKKKNIANHHH